MNARTKQQQDKVFETYFIYRQNHYPHSAHLLALSHNYIYIYIVPVHHLMRSQTDVADDVKQGWRLADDVKQGWRLADDVKQGWRLDQGAG